MKSLAFLKQHLFALSLMLSFTAFPASAYHSGSTNLGVGAVQCSYILAYQENPAAQKDIRMWVQKFVDEVNEEMSCLLYTSPSPRDLAVSRMPSSA